MTFQAMAAANSAVATHPLTVSPCSVPTKELPGSSVTHHTAQVWPCFSVPTVSLRREGEGSGELCSLVTLLAEAGTQGRATQVKGVGSLYHPQSSMLSQHKGSQPLRSL